MSSEDIRKQLPEDSARFDRIDSEFKVKFRSILEKSNTILSFVKIKIFKGKLQSEQKCIFLGFQILSTEMAKTPNVVKGTNKEGLVEHLDIIQKDLIICEKALAEYLETKRLAFPRFYFVSSADLLDILSNGNQADLVIR